MRPTASKGASAGRVDIVMRIATTKRDRVVEKHKKLDDLAIAVGVPLTKKVDVSTAVPAAPKVRAKIAPVMPPASKRQERAAQEVGLDAARELWLASPLFAPAMTKPAVATALRTMVDAYSGWHWLNSDPGRASSPTASARLVEIRAPTLIIIGELDIPDFITSPQRSRAGSPAADCLLCQVRVTFRIWRRPIGSMRPCSSLVVISRQLPNAVWFAAGGG